jgi:type II secretory pathway pseudopilin PulG
MMSKKSPSGFNLVGLIVSIGVFLILSASLWVAIDPAARINRAKDTRREQDVLILAQALKDYVRHNQGVLPITGSINSSKKVLCATTSSLTCDGTSKTCLTIDSSTDFLDSYLPTLPFDPTKTSSADSGYYLQLDENNNLIIGSCDYDLAEVTFNTRIKVAATPCLGMPLFDYCWYKASDVSMSCDQVCAENGSLSCVSGVSYSDPSCALNIALGPPVAPNTCSLGCAAGGGLTYDPGYHAAVDFCLYDDTSPAIDCAATEISGSFRIICACE